jgi:hypothetical protein
LRAAPARAPALADLGPLPAVGAADFERRFLAKLARCSVRCRFCGDADRDARRA